MLHLALTLPRWSYAGQNEPILGDGGPENAFVYPLRIPHMALTLCRWSYDGQNEPIPGAQQLSNNNVVQDGQLVGCVPPLAPPASTFCSVLTHGSRFDELPHYSPFDGWAGNVSRDDDPVAHFRFDFDPNGGPPARDA